MGSEANYIITADTVSVLALKKRGGINIVKPGWVIDCIDQMRAHVSVPTFIIPLEPRYLGFA